MKNELLAIGATLDWISPALAIANDVARGPSHTFIIPHDCGWSGYEVRNLLAKFDVETWGLMIISGHLTVSVPKHRARWAETILVRQGIPIDNPAVSTPPIQDNTHGAGSSESESKPQRLASQPDRGSETRFDRMTNRLERFSWFRDLQDALDDPPD